MRIRVVVVELMVVILININAIVMNAQNHNKPSLRPHDDPVYVSDHDYNSPSSLINNNIKWWGFYYNKSAKSNINKLLLGSCNWGVRYICRSSSNIHTLFSNHHPKLHEVVLCFHPSLFSCLSQLHHLHYHSLRNVRPLSLYLCKLQHYYNIILGLNIKLNPIS